jgi:transcriptional regulator with XRE-family HTH domain
MGKKTHGPRLRNVPALAQPGSIGARIARLRRDRHMTQSALAQASGVPMSVISMVEAGVRSGERIRVETARKLAQSLAVTLDYLCGVPPEGR